MSVRFRAESLSIPPGGPVRPVPRALRARAILEIACGISDEDAGKKRSRISRFPARHNAPPRPHDLRVATSLARTRRSRSRRDVSLPRVDRHGRRRRALRGSRRSSFREYLSRERSSSPFRWPAPRRRARLASRLGSCRPRLRAASTRVDPGSTARATARPRSRRPRSSAPPPRVAVAARM